MVTCFDFDGENTTQDETNKTMAGGSKGHTKWGGVSVGRRAHESVGNHCSSSSSFERFVEV